MMVNFRREDGVVRKPESPLPYTATAATFSSFSQLRNHTVSFQYDLQKSYLLCIGGLAGLRGSGFQRLVEVIDQVIHGFQAYGKANEIGRDTGLILLFWR